MCATAATRRRAFRVAVLQLGALAATATLVASCSTAENATAEIGPEPYLTISAAPVPQASGDPAAPFEDLMNAQAAEQAKTGQQKAKASKPSPPAKPANSAAPPAKKPSPSASAKKPSPSPVAKKPAPAPVAKKPKPVTPSKTPKPVTPTKKPTVGAQSRFANCKYLGLPLYGDVYFTKTATERHDFKVFQSAITATPDLVVFRTLSSGAAKSCGLWHVVDSPTLADFSVTMTTSRLTADIVIAYTNSVLAAGLK